MLRTVCLHGALGARFGHELRLDVESAVQAVRALALQIPGFRAHLTGGNYHVVRGPADERGVGLGVDTLDLKLGRATELHIIPAIVGAGGKPGMWQTIVGVAIVAAAFALAIPSGGLSVAALSLGSLGSITFAQIALVGASLAFSGISQLLASTPQMAGNTPTKDRMESFLFGADQNTVLQGGPVPTVFGRDRTKGVLISAGITVEKIDVTPPSVGSGFTLGTGFGG